MKLIELLKEELISQGYYNDLDIVQENLMDTHLILAELLNPDNAYEYRRSNIKNMYLFNDISDNSFFVRCVFQPIGDKGYFEVKSGWLDDNNKPHYTKLPLNSNGKDWDTRSDTVAKIYKDEILPFFKNQNVCDELVFKPIDKQRYYLSIRMVKKFKSGWFDIIEDFPKTIKVVK